MIKPFIKICAIILLIPVVVFLYFAIPLLWIVIVTVIQVGYDCFISERYDKNAPTEIFKIEEKRSASVTESFVISNPPNNKLLLKKVIEEYNSRTLPVDSIKKHISTRDFYRETKCLTRNYKEGEPYPDSECYYKYNGDDPGQQLGYHFYSRDFLVSTWYVYISAPYDYFDYSYCIRGDKTGCRDVNIKNIDSLFGAYPPSVNLR